MPDTRFSVSRLGDNRRNTDTPTWVVAEGTRVVAGCSNYDCALMIAALMNGDTAEAVRRRDGLMLKTDRLAR